MHRISMVQALSLWSDLEQAYHGTNGYGGNVAEIYIYRAMTRDPTFERGKELLNDPEAQDTMTANWAREALQEANETLHALLSHFAEQRKAAIYIEELDGSQSLDKWDLSDPKPFDYRIHVRVEAKTR